MKNRFPFIFTALLTAFILASLTACNLVGQNVQPQNPNPGTSPKVGNLIGENNGSKLGDKGPGINPQSERSKMLQTAGFDMQRANNIAARIGSIQGVGSLNVIVNGNTALVGYSPSGTPGDANAAKVAIANRIRQVDKSITNIMVTDSANAVGKINQLSNDIKSGRGGADLNSRFNQIIQGLKPVNTNLR